MEQNHYKYKVEKNNSINIWSYDKFNHEEYITPHVTYDIDRTLCREALVMADIGKIVYPVREQFIEEDRVTDIKYISKSFEQFYFPLENNKVEFSGFYFRPTILSTYARAYINMDQAKKVTFKLLTCGGLKIWINGELVEIFKPYSRNVPTDKEIELPFKKGENEILIFANDIAERDVFFYFELINLGKDSLDVCVPIKENQDEIDYAAKVMQSIYFTQDVYNEGKVEIGYDETLLKESFNIDISCAGDEKKLVLNTAINKLKVYDISNLEKEATKEKFVIDSGHINVKFKKNIGEVVIERDLFFSIYNEKSEHIKAIKSIEERKTAALKHLATKGEFCISKVLCILESKGKFTDECRELFNKELSTIEDKVDTADFRLPVFLLLYSKYKKFIPEGLMERFKKAILNFRYWMDEPGNDVMWYFSENHALLFHISQYLCGYYFPENKFLVSGRLGKEQYKLGHERLLKWFEEFLAEGYEEWNSISYFPIDFIGFFNLYEMAPDEDIKNLTKQALDMTFEIIASNLHNNIYTSSYGRTYEAYVKSIEHGELSLISLIAWGQGIINKATRAAGLFCVSSYIPPSFKALRVVEGNDKVLIERKQGFHKTYTYNYKSKDYALASAINFHPTIEGLQQHLMNVSLTGDGTVIWINHPGEKVFSGKNRPSYWAGNGVMPHIEQYKNTLLMTYNLKEDSIVKYIHAYMPLWRLDEYRECENWFFVRQGDAYLAMYFSNGFEITSSGANKDKELVSRGLEHGIVLKCSSKAEHETFEDFITLCMNSSVHFDKPGKINFKDYEYGLMELEANQPFIVNGKEIQRNAGFDLLFSKE